MTLKSQSAIPASKLNAQNRLWEWLETIAKTLGSTIIHRLDADSWGFMSVEPWNLTAAVYLCTLWPLAHQYGCCPSRRPSLSGDAYWSAEKAAQSALWARDGWGGSNSVWWTFHKLTFANIRSFHKKGASWGYIKVWLKIQEIGLKFILEKVNKYIHLLKQTLSGASPAATSRPSFCQQSVGMTTSPLISGETAAHPQAGPV